MKYILFISLPLYLLDRVTKYWVLHSIDPDQPRVVVPGFFHLVNITNTGAAFGSFKSGNTFFIAISCVALLFALVLLLQPGDPDAVRIDEPQHLRREGACWVVAAALGDEPDPRAPGGRPRPSEPERPPCPAPAGVRSRGSGRGRARRPGPSRRGRGRRRGSGRPRRGSGGRWSPGRGGSRRGPGSWGGPSPSRRTSPTDPGRGPAEDPVQDGRDPRERGEGRGQEVTVEFP